MAQKGINIAEGKLSGQVIIDQLIRNMEVGQFEMGYSVLLPCVFNVYLHADDHKRLAGVFPLIADDAKKALRARVAELNGRRGVLGGKKPGKQRKEYKIASKDWVLDFFQDIEGSVPPGDVEIHSELNEVSAPGFLGTKTTLFDREPSVTGPRPANAPAHVEARRSSDSVYAEIRYEDDSGPQLFQVTQNLVRVGRGGDDTPVELALYTNDEVSRDHLALRRDPATGKFAIVDKSTNGTWLDGKRLKRGIEEPLPEHAEIAVAETIKLSFEVRK